MSKNLLPLLYNFIFSQTDISAGNEYSLALKSDGTVVAWGVNWGNTCDIPKEIQGHVIGISAGSFHCLALRDNSTVAAWGWNYNGRCNVPVGLNRVMDISAGNNHSLALRADGYIVAWGANINGQCDIPHEIQGHVVSVSAGDSYSLALMDDGTALGWGNNSYNRFTIPANIQGHIIEIKAGLTHSLLLLEDGKIIAIGYNFNWKNDYAGQCDVPSNVDQVIALGAGDGISFVLKDDGTVVAWGNITSALIPEGLQGHAVAIAAGYHHCLALKDDGTVFGWPANYAPTNVLNLNGIMGKKSNLIFHKKFGKSNETIIKVNQVGGGD